MRTSIFIAAVLAISAAFYFTSCSLDTPSTVTLNDAGGPAPCTPPAGDLGPATYEPGIQYCEPGKVVDLFAGQTNDVGSVTIYNDNVNLYVTVYAGQGYAEGTEQIKMWVGGDLLNLPTNQSGNPVPGDFPYKITTLGGTTYTFTIPLNSLSLVNGCGDPIYVVVHVDVPGETAFGGDQCGTTGNRWWYYTTYNILCCTLNPPVFDHEETMFGKGANNITWVWTTQGRSNPEGLNSLRLTPNRWGWVLKVPTSLENTTVNGNLWAGAGLNNTSNGTLVGTLSFTWDGSYLTATFTMAGGKYVKEIHIYAKDLPPANNNDLAPGQYGNVWYFDPPVAAFTPDPIPVSDANNDGFVWFIFHGVAIW